ncbi:MAG: FprA family A-type flavoprotein [Bacteroidales bacterium]|nr:FprA family A-type flavoprotein [Bacteroidales bacterium]MBQ8812267.1 FprA family A-type flavoprotein [Bacteroidales bacterium]
MKQISSRIAYVGVNDGTKSLFEGLWPLPFGVSYNSYIVADEKVALIDTVECGFEQEYMDNIREAIGDRPIDYLVINHMEPDHSSLISYIRKEYPSIVIVTNQKAVPMIKGYQNGFDGEIMVIKEGDELSLGSCTLKFFMAPMVHWPETMVTYLVEEKTVFSGDAFGTFGSVAGGITDSEAFLQGAEPTQDLFAQFRNEMIRYYSNIVGKYGTPVQSALKKLSGLEIKRICSTHGPVWEKQIQEVVALYDKLSRYEVEHGVCIVYGSMYGNTAAAAHELAKELEARGIPYGIHDVAGNNEPGLGVSGALRDLFRYDTLAVGSPTYNNNIFPPVETFMRGVAARLVKGRRFYAFGSYTWAGSSVNRLNELAREQEFEIISEGGSFAQAYSPAKCDMAAVAELMK